MTRNEIPDLDREIIVLYTVVGLSQRRIQERLIDGVYHLYLGGFKVWSILHKYNIDASYKGIMRKTNKSENDKKDRIAKLLDIGQ